jgi:hypothetical protein
MPSGNSGEWVGSFDYLAIFPTGTNVIFLRIFFHPKWQEIWRFGLKLQLVYAKTSLHWFSRKNAIFFRRKLVKNAESSDHNPDP